MENININQGEYPGSIYIPGIGGIQLDQWNEDIVYDSLTLAAGAHTAGTENEFFKTLTSKNDLDTDMAEEHKLPEGWEMIVMKMGMFLDPRLGDAMGSDPTAAANLGGDLQDVTRIIHHTFTYFETGNSKIRRRAPSFTWPIGMGAWVVSGDGSQGAAGICAPMLARAPNLLVPIRLTSRLNFEATIEVAEAFTLNAAVKIWFVLYGFVKQPVG